MQNTVRVDTVSESTAAKRAKHRAPEWSASILEAGPSMWAAKGTKFEVKYQIKKNRLLFTHKFTSDCLKNNIKI